ncbi:MAG: DUF3782 domain-containing protein [Calditrichaeota bacterium]|nr:MAG: DUF3782 domain-containing protein [Calditrichota bacterium]
MEKEQIKQIIMQELPGILEQDPEVQEFILRLSRRHFADRVETESRFDRLLEELRRDREEQTRKWEENQRALRAMQEEFNRKWEENQRVIEAMQAESARKWEEQNRKWEENQRVIEAMQAESARKWEEQNSMWEEFKRRWDENQQVIRQILKRLEALDRKYDSTIGALGARWGLYSEQSFRNALKGILEEFPNVEVINVTEYDDTGEVFGRPDQVELDLIIKNGLLIICEIKSSMSKADMYLFERKARFYEKRHQRQAERLIVISPMVDKRAREVANRLGIEVYSFAQEAGPALAEL